MKNKNMDEYKGDMSTIKEHVEKKKRKKEIREKEEEKGVTGFLKRLDKEGEISDSGEVGEFDAKVKYGYSAKVGLEINDFPLQRGFHPRQRELKWAKKWGKRKARLEARLKRR